MTFDDIDAPIYYGTKRIKAVPTSKVRAGGEAATDGYDVWYEPDGYESWSPKDVFEAAYRPNGALDFAAALTALKEGRRVRRAGWNGKGMSLHLIAGVTPAHAPDSKMVDGVARQHFLPNHTNDDPNTYMPCIGMVTASGAVVPGWLASQTDMLAEDWEVVEEGAPLRMNFPDLTDEEAAEIRNAGPGPVMGSFTKKPSVSIGGRESLADLQRRSGKPVRMTFREAMEENERGHSVRRENWVGFDAMHIPGRRHASQPPALVRGEHGEIYRPTPADQAAFDWMFVTDEDLAHPQA